MFMTLARYKNENDVDVHEDVDSGGSNGQWFPTLPVLNAMAML